MYISFERVSKAFRNVRFRSLDQLILLRDLEDFGAGDELLGDNSGDGKHGKAAVVDLSW